MKVFLTGASGYIGSAVAEALRASGDQVIGLARSDEAAKKLEDRGDQVLRGDLQNLEALRQGAQAADGVIHTATTNNGDTDSAAVRAMLDAISESGKPFIFTSGVWVLGSTGEKVADEDMPVNPAALVDWRAGLEEDVLASSRQGIRAIVIRPAMVYGRGGGMFAGFIESAKGEGAKFVGDGENRWTGVHVDDLADLYVAALHQAPAGTLLHGASGDAVRVRLIAE
ncbi:MAG TPA: NAD-dependent epimerase/dehydratase family protein, partial [Capsulimonadaceae bacterium]|nr:NAD-dependent epimerase/dehydratase family protein [Capsulimonadaceae bacterium]